MVFVNFKKIIFIMLISAIVLLFAFLFQKNNKKINNNFNAVGINTIFDKGLIDYKTMIAIINEIGNQLETLPIKKLSKFDIKDFRKIISAIEKGYNDNISKQEEKISIEVVDEYNNGCLTITMHLGGKELVTYADSDDVTEKWMIPVNSCLNCFERILVSKWIPGELFKRSNFKMSSIQIAVLSGNLDRVKKLLDQDKKLDLEQRIEIINSEIDGFNLLQIASYKGYKDIAELLLAHGANIHSRVGLSNVKGFKGFKGFNSLHLAAFEDKYELIPVLKKYGMPIDSVVSKIIIDPKKNTFNKYARYSALHLAVVRKNVKTIEMLLNEGLYIGNLNYDYRLASRLSEDENISFLLDEKENQELRRIFNYTEPILLKKFLHAIKRKKYDIAKKITIQIRDANIQTCLKDPLALTCPLTKKLYIDPVIKSDGFVYEKTSIDAWQKIHDFSPVTGEEFEDIKTQFPDRSMKSLVSSYRTKTIEKCIQCVQMLILEGKNNNTDIIDKLISRITDLSSVLDDNEKKVIKEKKSMLVQRKIDKEKHKELSVLLSLNFVEYVLLKSKINAYIQTLYDDPPELTCNITQDLLVYPFTFQDGFVGEEAALDKWLEKNGESIMSREKVSTLDHIRNKKFLSIITLYRKQTIEKCLGYAIVLMTKSRVRYKDEINKLIQRAEELNNIKIDDRDKYGLGMSNKIKLIKDMWLLSGVDCISKIFIKFSNMVSNTRDYINYILSPLFDFTKSSKEIFDNMVNYFGSNMQCDINNINLIHLTYCAS
jgi:hypothetical protein